MRMRIQNSRTSETNPTNLFFCSQNRNNWNRCEQELTRRKNLIALMIKKKNVSLAREKLAFFAYSDDVRLHSRYIINMMLATQRETLFCAMFLSARNETWREIRGGTQREEKNAMERSGRDFHRNRLACLKLCVQK